MPPIGSGCFGFLKETTADMGDRKSAANLATGVAYQAINTVMGLVLPYLFITGFGSETNGLLSSVTQLFVYVELLEAGVGAAAMQAMYRPLANRDRDGVNGILAAASRRYLRTGALYLLAVAALALVYPLAVSTSLPRRTVAAVVFLQGCGGAVNYLVSGKYSVLLRAEGKLYILNSLSLVSSVLRNAGKIAAIAMGYGVVTVQAVHLAVTLLYSLAIVVYMKWKYQWASPWGRPDFQAIAQSGSALVHQLAWLVFNHTDIILLTFAAGDLALVSVYSLYLLVFEAIQNLLDVVGKSLQYKMGYHAQASADELRRYYRRYESCFLALSFALILITYLLVRGFIGLYTAGVTDADYLAPGLPELFAGMKLLSLIRQMERQAVEAAGHFRRTRNFSLVEMGLNLGVSLVLVFSWNIYGVLAGSIAALVYGVTVYTRYTNRVILASDCRRSCAWIAVFLVTFVALAAVGNALLPVEYESYQQLVLTAVPVSAAVCAVFGGELYLASRTRD